MNTFKSFDGDEVTVLKLGDGLPDFIRNGNVVRMGDDEYLELLNDFAAVYGGDAKYMFEAYRYSQHILKTLTLATDMCDSEIENVKQHLYTALEKHWNIVLL